ncbi:hypothetical protein HPY42_01715 [Coprothermobacteraceae bacterium]|nr:hypothetical protein [Coprothermobacteraceae bacterium]
MQRPDVGDVKRARAIVARLSAQYASLDSFEIEQQTAELEKLVNSMSEALKDASTLSEEYLQEFARFVTDLENLVALEREVLSFYERLLSSGVKTYGPKGKVDGK